MDKIEGMRLGTFNASLLKFKSLACPAIESGKLNFGHNIETFSEQLKNRLSKKYVSFANSSTSAHEMLFTAFRKLKSPDNSRQVTIMLQANCFPSVAFAAARAGLRILFADTDVAGRIDMESVLKGGPIDILHVTTLGGCVPKNLQEIFNWRVQNKNAVLIEDAAHSFGATRSFSVPGQVQGLEVRAGSWADFTVLSFSPTKPLHCGGGGAILSDSEGIIGFCRGMGSYGKSDRHGFDFQYPGWGSHFTELNAAVGLGILETFDMSLNIRKKVAKTYSDALASARLSIKVVDMGAGSWYKYPIVLDGRDYSEFCTYMETKGIELSSKIYPKTAVEICETMGIVAKGISEHYPNAVSWAKNHACLPMHSFLKDEEFERVISAVKQF